MRLPRRLRGALRGTASRRTGDDGFTLLETLISVAMISVVTASLTLFYTQSNGSTSVQSQAQVANQLASTAMEQVSLLPGTALVSGRPATCVAKQWLTPAPGVSSYLTQMQQVSDVSLGSLVCPTLANSIAALLQSEALPTVQSASSTINGRTVAFTQNFYVGLCWQNKPVATTATPTPGPVSCTKPTSSVVPAGTLPMLRVVIAVTWASSRCPANICSYVTDTLVTQNLTDLTFQLPS